MVRFRSTSLNLILLIDPTTKETKKNGVGGFIEHKTITMLRGSLGEIPNGN